MYKALQTVLVLVTLLLAVSISATTFKIPRLQPSVFVDGEASETRHMPIASHATNVFQITLSHYASLSNNVEVAFGRDIIPSDGVLDAEESTFILGWDSGVWFLGRPGQRDILTATPVDSGIKRRRTLTFKLRLNHTGEPQELMVNDDTGSLVFPPSPPSWMLPASWDTLRITTRGRDLAEEDIAVTFTRDGLVLILK